ncbi:MAG: RIP metalloprotease RseP [Candidatus Schekmanbacteria bacterium]|nr:RIP metalloprotease RseP [Candidatus Schekmanbacteria bacterium]
MLLTVLSMVVMIGVLVLVHELGHFLVAKVANVRVERFSIGFPPKIAGFRRGETEYVIGATPFGGYVKLAGEEPDGGTGDPRELSSKSVAWRFAIFGAGPAANLLIIAPLFALSLYLGIRVPKYLSDPPVVGWVLPESPAARAEVRMGDRIVAVNGAGITTWKDLEEGILQADGSVTVDVMRTPAAATAPGLEAAPLRVSVPPDEEKVAFRNRGILPEAAPLIGNVRSGWPADKAGMRSGDRVVAVDGSPIESWYALADAIEKSNGRQLRVDIARKDERLALAVTPDVVGGKSAIGIELDRETVLKRVDAVTALRLAPQYAWEASVATVRGLALLVAGEVSLRELSGPIRIGDESRKAAQRGPGDFLGLMAIISLNLGILNLLPIPVLDGGHILFLVAELVRRRPLELRYRQLATQVGLVLLLGLMVFVCYNDIRQTVFPGRGPF